MLIGSLSLWSHIRQVHDSSVSSGYPCITVLWWNKKRIFQYHRDLRDNISVQEFKNKNAFIFPMEYLFGCYKPEFWYFEVIETLRRLLLTGFLTLIYPGTTKQLVVGIFINIYFLTLYTFLNPYNEEELQYSSFLGQCQLIMIFFIYILFREKVDISHTFIDVMLILCVFAGIFYEAFVNPLSKKYSKRRDHVQRAYFIPSDDIEMSEKEIVQNVQQEDML
jgi:hypothetical protein